MRFFIAIVIVFFRFFENCYSVQTISFGNLATNRNEIALIPLNNKFFFLGGVLDVTNADGQIAISSIVEIYDTISATWSTRALSSGRYYATSSFSNDYLVFAGGLECYGPGPTSGCTNFGGSKTTDLIFSNSTYRTVQMKNERYHLSSIATPDRGHFLLEGGTFLISLLLLKY